jgi:hypothetical protein
VQLCQLYLEGTFEHMLPAKSPRSPAAASTGTGTGPVDIGASGAHTQLGSSGSLAHRYCITRASPHSPTRLCARDQLSTFLSESDAVSPSAGGTSLCRPVLSQMPAATDLLARAQQQHEELQQRERSTHRPTPTADAVHYHVLSERVARVESAVATMAATVSQLVQLLSAAADSSPQAAAAIWSTAAQLTADISHVSSSQSNIAHPHVGPEVAVEHDAAGAARASDAGAARASDAADMSPAAAIAAPEFNLRHKIARIPDLHERLRSVPSALPAHEAVRVMRR